MLKRLALAAILFAFGTGVARADAPARAASAALPGFDALVAEAKSAMMADPKAALDLARKAVAIAEGRRASDSQQHALATGLWLESEALTRINKLPEAHAAIDRAIRIVSKDNTLDKLDGDVALSAARIADNEGDIAQALKNNQKAYDVFLKIGEVRGQSIALQGLGSIYEEAHDFAHEIDYYNKAARVYSAEPKIQLSIENNVAFALQQMGRFQEALAGYQKALAIAVSLHSAFLEARILTNIAAVQAKLHRFSEAQDAASRALNLLGKDDENGWAPFVWGVRAEIELERGNLVAAEADLDKTFQGADLKTTIEPFRDMHEIAYKVYSATGKYQLALAHHEALKRLDDEGRSLTASANLALLGARFDFTNQKLEIEHLRADQLQHDISIRESRAEMHRVLFLSALSVALVIIVWISLRHRMVARHRNIISNANRELTRTLGERDAEISRRVETEDQLRMAKATAESASRAKSHFLANMSHELRTPLNAIIGFSDIISCRNDVPGKVTEYVSDISTSGRRLLSILSEILDAARLDAGKVSLSLRTSFLDEVIEHALTALRQDLAGKTVIVAGEKGVRVRADSARLRQVFEILLSNAAKFTAPGGRIEVTVARAPDGGVEAVVSDDGVGIPAARLNTILQPFGEVENAYSRTHGGVGLGLPIAHSLVALHDGTLTIESTPDKGTAVRIHLPAGHVDFEDERSGCQAGPAA
jgi:signal transduction histidine kinase